MTQVFLGMPHTGGWRTEVEQPEDTLRWGPTFPEGAHKTLANTQMRRNLGHATRTIRSKRADRVSEMPDWEDLRNAAEAVKFEVASRLPELLEQFEANVTARGGIVHWARDAAEANRIITDIIASKGVDDIVKVKSMATQETNLNEYLADRGITAHETDLAEMIVQLADDMPSHIVVPAIHRNRSEVRGIFLDRMEDAPEDLSDDPKELTAAPLAPAQQVPARLGGRLRHEHGCGRDRHGLDLRVRGQRAHVPDPAGHAHHPHGHREAGAPLPGRGDLLPAPAALGHR